MRAYAYASANQLNYVETLKMCIKHVSCNNYVSQTAPSTTETQQLQMINRHLVTRVTEQLATRLIYNMSKT